MSAGQEINRWLDAYERFRKENPSASLAQFLQQHSSQDMQNVAFPEDCEKKTGGDSFPAQFRRRLLQLLIPIDLHFRRQPVHQMQATDCSACQSMIPQRVEDYFSDFPDLRTDHAALPELLAAEFRLRLRDRETPQVEDYVQRLQRLGNFPEEVVQQFRAALETERSIHKLFDGVSSPPAQCDECETPTQICLPSDTFHEQDAYRTTDSPPEATASEQSAEKTGDEHSTFSRTGHAGKPETTAAVERLKSFLSRMSPFSRLPGEVQLAIAKELQTRSFHTGDVLLREGDPADDLLLLLNGRVEVAIQPEGEKRVIARVDAPSVLGEIGLMTQERRSATVSALSAGEAATLSRDRYERLAGRYPALSIAIAELIAQRIGTQVIDALCGKTIGSYRLQHRLGSGGMGIVYRAETIDTHHPVALKMLRHDLTLDPRATQRFHREATVVSTLRHRNIVQVYEQVPAYGTCFLAMEYCAGPNLAEFIAAEGPLPLKVVKQLLGQLASALQYAHASGVAHRDLKPGNVILHRNGLLKLVDFGLARSFLQEEAGLTAYGQVMGTPRYMAPEQLMGARGDDKSDLFALGCLAYEMLTGQPLFRSRRIEDLLQERATWKAPTRKEIRGDLDEELFEVVNRCLQPSPAERQVNLESIVRWGHPLEESLLSGVRSRAEILLARFRSATEDPTLSD